MYLLLTDVKRGLIGVGLVTVDSRVTVPILDKGTF